MAQRRSTIPCQPFAARPMPTIRRTPLPDRFVTHIAMQEVNETGSPVACGEPSRE
jgi:hypothetical protein